MVEWARTQGFEPAPHHRLILRELCALVDPGCDYDTLFIFAPPGSAKSHHVSVVFPPWWMARMARMNPTMGNVIAASHSTELAEKWGRRVRNIIAANALVLGVTLADDSQAAHRWQIAGAGEYLAVGAQAGIAGFRADLGIIDDPFGSKEDAYSERVRDRVWDWYLDDFSARLKPGAKRVVMHTRWHLDDMAGRAIELAERTGQKVRVVSLPAIAGENDVLGRRPGEYLWDEPEGYNYAAFLRARQIETPAVEWSAMYQQEPVPAGGGYFKAEWIRYYDPNELPKNLRIYGASDYAVTDDGGDFTEHGIGGIDPEGNLYLTDWWFGQTSSDVWVDVLLDMVARHAPLNWGEEQGQIIKSVGPFLTRRMEERRVYFGREQFTSAVDKPTRARSIQGRMSQGKVLLPSAGAPWVARLVAQLLAFPAGKHDDGVDVLSLFGRMLDKMYPPKKADDAATKAALAKLKRGVI